MIVEEVKEKEADKKKEAEQRPNNLIIGLCIVTIIAIATMMVLVTSGVVGPGIFRTY